MTEVVLFALSLFGVLGGGWGLSVALYERGRRRLYGLAAFVVGVPLGASALSWWVFGDPWAAWFLG